MNLDHGRMLKEIYELVGNDFCLDMEHKLLPGTPSFSKEDSVKMAEIISKVYRISHCIYCKSCGVKYKVKGLRKNE